METHPLIDQFAIHFDTFAGDVYTLDTASITLTAGALTVGGIATITGIADGGRTSYDLKVGDTTTPDYGMIQFGNAVIGRTSYKAGNIDLDGSILIQNIGGPVTSQVEFCFATSTGASTRFALAKPAVGNASYHSRSMLIAGPAPADTDYVKVSYWQTNNNIFDNLVCDTSGDGADLGVQNDLEVEGDIFVDSIIESTTDAGVTIETVLLKDSNLSSVGNIDGSDIDISAGTGDYSSTGTIDSNVHTISSTGVGAKLIVENTANNARIALHTNIGTPSAMGMTVGSNAGNVLYEEGDEFRFKSATIAQILDGSSDGTLRWTLGATGIVTMTNDLVMAGNDIDNCNNIQIAEEVQHHGNASTNIAFIPNTITLETNDLPRFRVGSTVVLLGDITNGDTVDVSTTTGVLTFEGDAGLVIDKTAGLGIKVDNAAPTFGFADLLGDQFSKNTGGTKPALVNYNGAIDAWQFSNGDEAFLSFHIPHDYVPSTDIHLHVHWSQNAAGATGGTIDFKYFAIYAKGHNQASGSAFTSTPITATFSSIDINDGGAGLTRYQQHLTEVTISAATATAALFDRDDFEPDGVIELTLEMDATNLTGTPSAPFIHYVDIHYQTTSVIGTKSRTPDFYA